MGIKIGNNNKIKNSIIAENSKFEGIKQKTKFAEKHPLIIGIFVSVISGIILLFGFCEGIVEFIEKIF